jgi:hypothetical protein
MFALVLFASALAAGPSGETSGDAVIRLYVRPMAAPRPALKYQLLPDLGELTPGNSAQEYLKSFMEQRAFFYGKEGVSRRNRFRKMSLLELRLEPVAEYGSNALRCADRASRMDTLDWQALRQVEDGGLDVVPAEVAPLQILAEALQVRLRFQLAKHQFGDAIGTATTLFALGRHLGEHPNEVAALVGFGAAHLALDSLAEMVQQTDCPNLYWALTDMPSPLVGLRKSMQGHRLRVAAELRPIRDDGPMTDAEIEAFVRHLSGVLSFARERAGLPPRAVRTRLEARFKDQTQVAAARKRLVEAGHATELVSQFQPAQAILLDEKREYAVRHDDLARFLNLPLWELGSQAVADPSDAIFVDLLPDVVRLRRARAQLDQEVALLRIVEALRLHASAHEGQLPTRLTDIGVPMPVDPVTGKPFDYDAEGATGHLCGPAPGGATAGAVVHYAVTLLK